MDESQFEPTSEIETVKPLWWKRKWLWWLMIIAFLWFSYWYDQTYSSDSDQITSLASPAASSYPSIYPSDYPSDEGQLTEEENQNASLTAVAPSRTVESSGGFKLTNKSASACTAQAPADWTMTSNREANTADLYAPGKVSFAGYAIPSVNTQMAQFAYLQPAPVNDPELYSDDLTVVSKAFGKAIVNDLGGDGNLIYTDELNQIVGDYTARTVASSTHRGIIIYRTTSFPGDGVTATYIEPMYFGFTTAERWPTEGLLVAYVASTISCTTQLVNHDGPVVKARTSSGNGGSRSSDTNGSDAGYNPQLGTEEVHNRATGDNYVVSPSTNWSSDGPQGAGYYTQNGNDVTKLEPGRSD